MMDVILLDFGASDEDSDCWAAPEAAIDGTAAFRFDIILPNWDEW